MYIVESYSDDHPLYPGRPRTVELTEHENRASARFSDLLDQGLDCNEAADTLRTEMTDLSDEFISWLTD